MSPSSSSESNRTAYPQLVGDIGGTNARFAIFSNETSNLEAIDTLPTADFATLGDAIKAYLKRYGVRPACASLGIANPLLGDQVQMTNHHWSFSVGALRSDLNLERLLFLNDFTALALGIPQLQPKQYRQWGGPSSAEPGAIGVLGPGTGLGMSGLVPYADKFIPLAGEGGHATLPAYNAEEAAVIAWFGSRFGHVSAERILCGAGIPLLYQAMAELRGATPEALTAPQVTERALAGTDALCVDAMRMFCAMLGTVSANLALTLGAMNGVYIGGGIIPKLGEFFYRSSFRERFEDKGRFKAYLSRVPVYVVTEAPHCALVGAHAALELRNLAGTVDNFAPSFS